MTCEMPIISHRKMSERWLLTLWLFSYAFWVNQCYCCVSGSCEWHAVRYAQSFPVHVHQWHTRTLEELKAHLSGPTAPVGATISLSLSLWDTILNRMARLRRPTSSYRVPCSFPAPHSTSWRSFLPMMEYTHNSIVLASTGLALLKASPGHQPPLFEV